MTASTPVTAETTATEKGLTLRRGEWLLLASVLLLAVLLRLPGLHLPLERDEGAYAYVAFDWLRGGLPYRDAFDHKPPLIYLLYMPALLRQPPSALDVRVWACVLHLAGVLLVYAIGRRVWYGAGGLLAALLFATAGSAFELQGMVLNTDQALVLPALGALFCALRYNGTRRAGTIVAAGALVAAATLIKPVALVLAPCLLLASGRAWGRLWRTAMLASLGVAAVALPVLAYFMLRGGLPDLVFALLSYNSLYAAESQARFSFAGLANMYAPFVPLTVAAIGGVALLRSNDEQIAGIRERHAGWSVAAWCGALLVAAVGSLRPWVHYFYPVLPFLSLLAAPCVIWLAHNRGAVTFFQRSAATVAPLLLTAILVVPFISENMLLAGATPTALAERMYGDDGRDYFANAAGVAAFVRERTRPDDLIYVFASEPEVYVLAGRRSASRWIYDYPLRLVDGARAELLRDLQARPPALAVVYYGLRPPGLNRLVDERGFRKIGQFGGFEVFGPGN